ncbi:MFS transporter [Rhodococcus opacus]|uniref:MFS transporter n=1 Tax=Rhodococcus opacus TaxID=37919 RepID=UPI000FFC0236|nr:MFS transporter [Rhodococcus opacus]
MSTDIPIHESLVPHRPAERSPREAREARKAVIASYLGGALEYYDFFIYGSAAALIFSRVFFPAAGAHGLLASFASFGVAYIARPLGAVVFGHFGDKFGRKRVMIWALAVMGASTFVIGCLPDYRQIGVAAPVLLVAMRLLQGLSAGGETAGASSLVLEHAPESRRGFYGSWIQSGIVSGFVLATIVFIPISTLPDDQLLSWGWRIPFWASAILLAIAFLVRRTLVESEVFAEVKDEQSAPKFPVVELLKNHWADVLRVGGLAVYQATYTMVMVFGLAFATTAAGLSRTTMLYILLAFNLCALIFTPIGGYLSDRFGRKPVFAAAAVGCAVTSFPYMFGIAHQNYFLIIGAGILMNGIIYAIGNGTTPAYFSELFTVRVRYSGTAIGIQVGMLMSGFSPLLATAWVGTNAAQWSVVACIISGLAAVAVVASLSTSETSRTALRDLGDRKQPARS